MSDFEFDDEFDAGGLDELDAIEDAIATGRALPPKSIVNKPGLVQRDLFGAKVVTAQPQQAKAGPSRSNTAGLAGSGGAEAGAGGVGETRAKVRLSKRWDPASFAKHGWSKKNAAAAKAKAKGGKSGKGKGRASRLSDEEDDWDEDDVLEDSEDDGEEFLVDTMYDPTAPIPPIKWPPDQEAIKTFIYPVQADKPLRTYQYNIIQKALYDNTLVSLPTGLGKTFIAAVVMLNFYRWYPRGKVLFLAPTRPLVSQQIKACHFIAGIPQADCVELTGSTIPKLRAVGWATKRVIYSTPQTVERDLAKGRLDPRDVTCIVIDEAHRASGDYSYCGVVRYMMSRNPHFRLLALTATPGSRGEAVQDVIDNLHIGTIEVRADDSFDIRQYIHKKSFDLTVLPLGGPLGKLRDKWGELMMQYINPLYAAKLLWSKDPVMLAPFAVQQAFSKIKGLPGGGKSNGKFFPMVKTLGMMARAMEYLVIQSVTSFESNIKDIEQAGSKNLVSSAGFRDILRETAALRAREGYVGHPKMEKLRSMCLEHFTNAQHEVDEYTGEKRETRVMIFCNFRAVVEEICACLNTQRPLIKATPFVGQASSKGVRGKSQKEQLETIKKFKKGVYNVLVATSIGEEGLDIGEIDLIICYEANKSPIRMLQRVGRTGRARDGHIIVLMSEGREERNWDKANDAYNEVQNALTSNKVFDLYVDGERLLPDHVKPVCEKVEIKALPLDVETMTMNGRSRAERKALAEKKPKRKVDVNANAPDDAFMGFRTAGAVAAAAKVKPPSPSQVLRDRKAEALLTVEEEAHLRTRWQQDNLGRPIRPHRFSDVEDLPFQRNRPGSALCITHHSDRYRDVLSAFRVCDQLAEGKAGGLDSWHDKHSSAFDPKLVQLWRAEDREGPVPRHTRLKRPPPSSPEPEDFPATFPMTGFVPASAGSPSNHVGNSGDQPLFDFSQPSPPPCSATRRRSPSPAYSAAPPSPELPALPAVSAPAPIPPPSSSKGSQVLDLSMLDSDEEDIEMAPRPPPIAAAAPLPPKPPAYAADTTYDFDDDVFDLPLSDSDLLTGAAVRRFSASPVKPRPMAKSEARPPPRSNYRTTSQQSNEIILDDSEEEPAAAKAVARSSAPSTMGPQPAAVPPPRPSSAKAKPASGSSRPFIPPRPSSAACATAPASKSAQAVPPRVPSRAASPPSTDEYSFFDLPDEDIDACLANIPQQAVRGAVALARDKQLQANEDLAIMPPPPVASTSKAKLARYNGRVPDSSDQPSPASSSAVKSGFRPAGLANSHAKTHAESSSPVVGGGLRARRLAAVAASVDESDISLEVTQAPKLLNRLRRHRQAEDAADCEGEEEGILESSPPPAKKAKKDHSDKKRKKKPILTHKLASRLGIFDNEAVNDDASADEASSEEYNSEDSEDRAFVADETFEEESPGRMAQFYRDSLGTQAPAAFGTPAGFGRHGARWQGRDGVNPARRPVPLTPASQPASQGEADDWDYGSFVVASDEEIEHATSSPAF
ncbi:hypothetical protein JCM11641_007648 [Rhodosporidiobolus odoratus]